MTQTEVIKKALALLKKKEWEPVAWSYWQSCLNDDGTQTAPWVHRLSKFKPTESIINKDVTPLYTTPPQPEQKQEYQFGVYSAEDLDKAWKLGYDNCKAQSSWTLEDVKKAWKRGYAQAKKEQRQNLVGIYTTPPQRKPLSDEKMKAIWYSTDSIMGWYSFQEVTKAIEAAHGIKE